MSREDYCKVAWDRAVEHGLEPQGERWDFDFRCPVKPEHGRACTLNEGSDRRVFLYCKGGCFPENIAAAMNVPGKALRRPDDDWDDTPAVVAKSTSLPSPAPVMGKPTTGVDELRASLGAVPVDLTQATLDPLTPLPGLPFVLPHASHHLSGPDGGGKSQVAQVGVLDVALAGHRVLYLSGEVTLSEFVARARLISETRDGKLTDAAVWLWRERVAFADIDAVLPAIVANPAAWRVVCADYALVVLDAVSDAGAVLGLKFSKDNDDWATFHSAFVKPCQERTAVLLLDNIGHGEDAKDRAIGASGKQHKPDVRLSAKRRDDPLSLIITCRKARPVRSPFRRLDQWVAYEAGCKPPLIFDAAARDRERAEREGPDPVAVVIAALRAESPQGQLKLEGVLRDAGVKGSSEDLRAVVKAMADDPDCPVRDTAGRGFALADPESTDLCRDPMSTGHVRVSLKERDTDGRMGHDNHHPEGDTP